MGTGVPAPLATGMGSCLAESVWATGIGHVCTVAGRVPGWKSGPDIDAELKLRMWKDGCHAGKGGGARPIACARTLVPQVARAMAMRDVAERMGASLGTVEPNATKVLRVVSAEARASARLDSTDPASSRE